MNFEEYLDQKKIDRGAFKASRPADYAAWEELFGQVHPESFTMQKKFLINKIRREFPVPQTK